MRKKDIMLICKTNETTSVKNYETPLFIYNFLKKDIANLLIDEKRSTIFSSESLKGEWGGNKFSIFQSYQGSTSTYSMYIAEAGGGKIFNMVHGNRLRSNIGGHPKTAAHNSVEEDIILSLTTYCMSAIR